MARLRSNTSLILLTLGVALLAGVVLWLARDWSGTTDSVTDAPATAQTHRTNEPSPTGSVPTGPRDLPTTTKATTPRGTTPTAPVTSSTISAAAKRQQLIDDPRFIRQADGSSIFRESAEFTRHLEQSDEEPITDLEAVDAIFGAYIWAFKELPEGGENHEITAGLTGKNPKKLIFIPPDHARLDAKGNLLDRWETPYFFHKQSESKLEIISAGPDRRLWSSDDIRLMEDLP